MNSNTVTPPVRRIASRITIVFAVASWIAIGYIGVRTSMEYRHAQEYAMEARAIAQEQANLTHSLMVMSKLAIVSTDVDGKIVGWNEGATKQLGWNAEDMVGKSITHLMADPINEKHIKAFKNRTVSAWIREGKAVDCVVKRKDGANQRVVVFTYEVNKPPARFVAYIHTPKEVIVKQQVPTR